MIILTAFSILKIDANCTSSWILKSLIRSYCCNYLFYIAGFNRSLNNFNLRLKNRQFYLFYSGLQLNIKFLIYVYVFYYEWRNLLIANYNAPVSLQMSCALLPEMANQWHLVCVLIMDFIKTYSAAYFIWNEHCINFDLLISLFLCVINLFPSLIE